MTIIKHQLREICWSYEQEVSDMQDANIQDTKNDIFKLNTINDVWDYYAGERGWELDWMRSLIIYIFNEL